MDLNTVANVATALAVLTGLVFGIFQIGQVQRKRRDLAAIEAAHGFLTPEFREAIQRIHALAPPVEAETIRRDRRLVDDAEIIV